MMLPALAEVDTGVPATTAVVLGSFGSCLAGPQVIARLYDYEGVTVQVTKLDFPTIDLRRGRTIRICFDVTGVARIAHTEDSMVRSSELPTIPDAVFGEGKRVLNLPLLHQFLGEQAAATNA